MRTSSRVAGALAALAASLPIGMPAAYAEAVPALKPVEGAWFWDKQVSGNTPAGVPYPGQIPAPVAQVDADRLAVSYQGGKETTPAGDEIAKPEKETYLMWDVFELVEPGSTIDEFEFTLPLDPNGKTNKLVAPDAQPQLIACRPLGGFATVYGDSFANKPADDCSNAVFGTFDAAKQAYVFDITTYAQDWVDEDNFGIAIRPKTDETTPFQLQFANFPDAVAKLSFTPPVVVDEDPVDEEVPVDTTPVDTGTVSPPTVTVVEPQPQPQAPAAPRPVVLAPAKPIQRVAATPMYRDTSLGGAFWAGAAGALLLVGFVSIVLGDDRVAARGHGGTESKLDRVLRARQGRLAGATQPEPAGRTRVRTV